MIKIEFYEVCEYSDNVGQFDRLYPYLWRLVSKVRVTVFCSGRAEEEKSLEAGADWRTVWGEDYRPGQTLNILREPRVESVQVRGIVRPDLQLNTRVPETATVLLGGGVNFADLPEYAQIEFQVETVQIFYKHLEIQS